MKIIITAGPMSESIDSVRKITNTSSGMLGSIIANTLLKKNEKIEKIFYIGQKRIVEPSDSNRIERIYVNGSDDLLEKFATIIRENEIFAVVHSAAIGDYKTNYISSAEEIAKEIAAKFKNNSSCDVYNEVLTVLKNPTGTFDKNGKIKSYHKNVLLNLVPTVKVISKIKELSPKTLLIGFKLLSGVSNDELVNTAFELLKKNNADYVVANDITKINEKNHFAFIVDKQGKTTECTTKEEIAEIINEIINK